MKVIEINGSLRESVGKTNARIIRKQKLVPCVLYGGKENIHFQADEKEFRTVLFTPNSYLLRLKIGDKIYDATIKDTQYHPVSDDLIHADFYQIDDQKKIVSTIPVQLNGFSKGVKAGGKLTLVIRKLKVKGLPVSLPDILNIDIENLELGKTIKVGDLSFPDVELLDPKSAVVVAVRLTRAAKGEAAIESLAAAKTDAAKK